MKKSTEISSIPCLNKYALVFKVRKLPFLFTWPIYGYLIFTLNF